MQFSKVFPLLIAKAEKKGRTRAEVMEVTAWMTGYTPENLEQLLESGKTYGEFLREAPAMNPARMEIRGKVCGVQVDAIDDPLTRDMRILDKLVDDLARGKSIEKITGTHIMLHIEPAKQAVNKGGL